MEHQPQWQGNVYAKLKTPKAHQVWPLIQDFFNLHKWCPTVDTSHGLHGTNGQPGCVRYTAGPCKDGDSTIHIWATERLVSIDPVQMALSYEIVDTNVGFECYMATIRLVPRENGCLIEWSFKVNPVKQWRLENLIEKYQEGLERMAMKIEETFP